MAKEAEAKALESRVAKLETELELLHQMYHRLAREFDRFSRPERFGLIVRMVRPVGQGLIRIERAVRSAQPAVGDRRPRVV